MVVRIKKEIAIAYGGIVNSSEKGVFDTVAKPFVKRCVNLDGLSGMGLTLPTVGAMAYFFLFGAFKTSFLWMWD